jgi:DNA-binding response OmpR family regulator
LIKAPLEKLLENESPEKDTYKMMLKNSDQLLEMINEILELSKSSERLDVLDKNSISIKDFMEELIHQFSPVSKAKEIRIHLDYQTERQVLIGDKKKLNMVFNNLIKNALENTPNGALTGIVVKETQSNQWLFEFYNSGDQIPPEELPHLFDRYYRGDKNETEGNGIGLHICKEAIEQHDGSIEVVSNKNKTSFFVKLPGQVELQEKSLEKELSLQTTQVALEEQQDLDWSIGSDKPKLLIVEDHGEMRDFIKSGFQDDFTVILAKDGEEAMDKVHAQHPDLIISDVMMPNKDGFELTQNLKSKMETSHIPIILLTAKADTSSRIQGLELEADDYLLKPFHFKELELRARNILKQRKLLKEQFSSNPSLLKRAGRNPMDQAFLEKAQSIVLENLTKSDFSVQEFCEMLALNRTSVHQKFKALLEMSTSQFIRTVKVQKAKQLLEEGKLQLSEITSESGFNNRQNFAKAFKEQYGLSPSEYRDRIEERV